MIISMYQMNVRHGALEENLEKVGQAAREAKQRKSDLLVLPELWATGFPVGSTMSCASSLCGELVARISELAAANRMYLLGSMLVRRTCGVTNTAMLFSPHGAVTAQYDKIHLFRLMDEHRHLAAGSTPVTVKAEFGTLSIAICYDLRFPELFRSYAVKGTQLMLVPAAWPRARIEHWQVLLRARAIENSYFVAGCNQAGKCGGQVFGGHSAMVGPSGEIAAAAEDDETLITARIDLSAVRKAQESMPVLSDRKPLIYG